jgi:nitrite reductase/ring-hydroxylating ferredoxin subunit
MPTQNIFERSSGLSVMRSLRRRARGQSSAMGEVLLCRLDDIPDPGCRMFDFGAGGWPAEGFVVRRGDSVYGYVNVCPHAGHALNWKPDAFLTRDGNLIMCSAHGAVFEIETGLCVAGPCPGQSLRRLTVRVADGRVWVRPVGDALP